jgi:hypothetical protein
MSEEKEFDDVDERPDQYKKCGQNILQGQNAFNLLTTNEASIQWYGGKSNYNFGAGRPNSDAVK